MHLACILLPMLLAACGGRVAERAPSPAMPGLAPGVTVLPGAFVAGEQPDGNSILLRGRDGLIVFDSGRHAAHAQRILDAANAARLPIVAIVNSHWHLDHVSGNAMLREAYPRAEVYASDAIHGAMRGFLADYRVQLQQAIAQAPPGSTDIAGWREEIARIDAGARLFPTQVVSASMDRRVAGRDLHFGLERDAVSGGDVWVLDRATGTLLAGDLVTLPAPLFDTACPHGWSEALAKLSDVPFVQLVPGHGAPMTHAQFDAYRHAFDGLLACAAGDAAVADCAAGWERDLGLLLPPDQRKLGRSLLDYYFQNVLRTEPAKRDRYCHAG